MNKLYILITVLLCVSCVTTEVPERIVNSNDTTAVTKKPHKPLPRDTVVVEDTATVPIGFNPSVEDWEDNEIGITQ